MLDILLHWKWTRDYKSQKRWYQKQCKIYIKILRVSLVQIQHCIVGSIAFRVFNSQNIFLSEEEGCSAVVARALNNGAGLAGLTTPLWFRCSGADVMASCRRPGHAQLQPLLCANIAV